MTQTTIDLGKIKFNWRGAYDPSVTYYKDDVVSYGGSSHILKVTSSTAVAPVYVNGVHPAWDLMVQGGDPSSIMTTQGDLLVKGASGLERVPVGTAGQALAVNSAGNGVEFVDAGYRPGEIIETLAFMCDGTTRTLSEGRSVTVQNVTGYQGLSTSYQDCTGSVINYKPPTGTKQVKYEYKFMFEDESYGGISHFRLYIDDGTPGNWQHVTDAYHNLAHQYSTSSHGQDPVNLSWVFNLDAASTDYSAGDFAAGAWNQVRGIKWYARDYSGSYRVRLHYNTWMDGTSASGIYQFIRPQLYITAIA